jgi:hypothetical protein
VSWRSWERKELTPELVEEIAGHYRSGATDAMVAGLVEVPTRALRRWLMDGEDSLGDLYEADTGSPNAEAMLYLASSKALSEYLLERVSTLSESDEKEWRSSAWVLERRDDTFNPASRVEVTGEGGGAIEIEGRSVVGIADIVALYVATGQGHLLGLEPGDTQEVLPRAGEVLPDH